MAVEIDGKTYRNLPEQVEKNANDIQRLLDIISSFGNVMRYCGSVATYADLPTEDNQIGDVWNVLDTGNNYAWDGEGWDEISSIVDLSGYVAIIQTDGIDDESAYVGAKVGDVVVDSAGFVGVIKKLEKTGSTINLITISGLENNNVPTTYVGNNGSWSSSSMNYVTLDTAQNISGEKTHIKQLNIKENSNSPSNATWNLYANTDYVFEIRRGTSILLRFATQAITSYTTFIPTNNGQLDLGDNTHNWKDLYLSGKVYLNNNYLYESGNVITWYINQQNRFEFTQNTIRPVSDGQLHLGNSTKRIGDIYLSGSLKDGTNSVTVADLVWKEYDLVNNSASVATMTIIAGSWYSNQITVTGAGFPAGTKEVLMELSNGRLYTASIIISATVIEIEATTDMQNMTPTITKIYYR